MAPFSRYVTDDRRWDLVPGEVVKRADVLFLHPQATGPFESPEKLATACARGAQVLATLLAACAAADADRGEKRAAL